jgi:hypothetical protein
VLRRPAALKPAEAKAEWLAWLDVVEAKIDRLRKMATAAPVRLSRREVAMYAGQWYREQVEKFSDDPGDPMGWDVTLDDMVPDEAHARPHYAIYEGPWVRQAFVVNGIDELLAAQGLVLEPASREALLDEAHSAPPGQAEGRRFERTGAPRDGAAPAGQTVGAANLAIVASRVSSPRA